MSELSGFLGKDFLQKRIRFNAELGLPTVDEGIRQLHFLSGQLLLNLDASAQDSQIVVFTEQICKML